MHSRYVLAGMILAATVAPGASSGAVRVPKAASSLCLRTEQTLFSCPIGIKTVSVCGQGDHAVYRFGKPPRVELEGRRLSFAEHAFSGGGESQIVFENKGYRYVIYDRLVRTAFGADGRHSPEATMGLIVRKAGRTISTTSCVGMAGTGISPAAAKAIPPGAFVSH